MTVEKQRKELLRQASNRAKTIAHDVKAELPLPPRPELAIEWGRDAGASVPERGKVKIINEFEQISGGTIHVPGSRAYGSGGGKERTIKIEGKIHPGDIAVFTPDALTQFGDRFLPYWKAIRAGAVGFMDTRGSTVDHGAAAAKELGKAVAVGVPERILALSSIKDGALVVLYKGGIYPSRVRHSDLGYTPFDFEIGDVDKLLRNRRKQDTVFRLNLAFPEVLIRHPHLANLSDGVGFFRTEFLWIDLCNGVHPRKLFEDKGEEAVDFFVDGLKKKFKHVLDLFGGKTPEAKMVWFRTQDMGTDFLRALEYGSDYEKYAEANPAMGVRGSRRLGEIDLWGAEAVALNELAKEGYKNIGLFGPMIASAKDFEWWDDIYFDQLGLRGKVKEGIMVEIAGVTTQIPEIVKIIDSKMPQSIRKKLRDLKREGDIESYNALRDLWRLSYVCIGTNDFGQSTGLADRTTPELAWMSNPTKGPVFRLIVDLLQQTKTYGIETAIGGQAGSTPKVVQAFRPFGLTGTSVNPDPETLVGMIRAMAPWDQKVLPKLSAIMEGKVDLTGVELDDETLKSMSEFFRNIK